jgi:hypothetical protein
MGLLCQLDMLDFLKHQLKQSCRQYKAYVSVNINEKGEKHTMPAQQQHSYIKAIGF